ncbi:hypothetical protein HMPREF0043_02012, partial [Actinobaculum sp. oral taxon 183 str. F0552]
PARHGGGAPPLPLTAHRLDACRAVSALPRLGPDRSADGEPLPACSWLSPLRAVA